MVRRLISEDDDFLVDLEHDDSPFGDGHRANMMFADPGGRSALRAAGPGNPRNRSCPNCGARNVLTPADVAQGYQCNRCADQAERGGY